MHKSMETQYRENPEQLKQHYINKELFSILHCKIKNKKEQQFFAYLLTQIETLLKKYKNLAILRDMDNTICYRLKPEEYEHYDVIRKGFLPLIEHLHNTYPDRLDFGILSRRQKSFLDNTFKKKENKDRPDNITNHFESNYIFSSRDYPEENSPSIYHCQNESASPVN